MPYEGNWKVASTFDGSWLWLTHSEKDVTLKFHSEQHEFYCGIDLHANAMHVCVVDHAGNKIVHKTFNTEMPEEFFVALQPFEKNGLNIGCESTFN